MLELHGWITLRESYKANDEEENMKHIFGKTKEDNLLCDLQYEYDLNGNRTAKMGSMVVPDALGNISLQSRDYTIDMMGEIAWKTSRKEEG